MRFTTALLLLAAFFAAWLVFRSRQRSTDATANDPAQWVVRDTTYHAVSIKYAASACESAKALTGRRFLASAAPRLPLPECDANACNCRFVHHDDRRSGQDRRSPFQQASGLDGTGTYRDEQREGSDRRHDDDRR